jgi:DNA-binding SARP family transcriptional activator
VSSIKVSMFGKFDIVVDGQSVLTFLGKSPKSTQLLKYLILNQNKAAQVVELIDIFWTESDQSSNPESALKTMISRIRTNLSKAHPIFKNCILAENRGYRWNPDLPCEVDVFVFEELVQSLQSVTELTPESRTAFNQVLDLYGGDLSYASIEEEWTVGRSLYLHHLYTQTVYHYIDLLKKTGEHELIIHICRLALDIDIFDDRLNLELMQALRDTGQNTAALLQYRHVTSAYYKYLGTEPSEEILGFYKSLIKTGLASEADIQTIRQELVRTQDQEEGAFVCDYSVFKDIYQLQMRNIERQQQKMFLALFTVTSPLGEEHLPPLRLDAVMRELLRILQSSLRKGDTIARYSATQYAILLPMMSYSDGNIVLNRIKRLFYQAFSDNSVTLNFHFGGLDDGVL